MLAIGGLKSIAAGAAFAGQDVYVNSLYINSAAQWHFSLSGNTLLLDWNGGNVAQFANNGIVTIPSTLSAVTLQASGALVLTSFTDDSATTGNRTVNKVRGFNAFAATTSTITITNSFVSATSQVVVTIMTNDATALLKNVVPGAGSFVVTLNANTTGITKFAWTVIN